MEDAVFDLLHDLDDSHWWILGRQTIIGGLADELLKRERASVIVDVGCGTGGTLASLSGRYTCIGVDPSERAIGYARVKYPTLDYRVGTVPGAVAETMPHTSLFLMLDILEHVQKDAELLRSVVATASSGSNILITVPANLNLWSNHDVTAGHLRRYDLKTLSALWSDLDVDVLLNSYFNARLYPIIWAIRLIGRILGQSAGAHGTDFSLPPKPANELLKRVFSGELHRLLSCLNGSAQGYSTGTSIMAVLKKR